MTANTAKTAPFPFDAVQTGITLAYRNNNFISDNVMPRVPVGTKEFTWNEYSTGERFTVPETLVGRKGQPNELEFGYEQKESSVKDYGLDDVIPNDDITQAANSGINYSPVGHATEALTDLILLDRERRVSNIVFNEDTYATGFKETLSGTDQWSDYDNSKPREQLLEALDKPILRPNILVLGQTTWTKMRQNPTLVSSILGNSGQQGTITKEQLAELLEIEEVIVGQGWVNVAKPNANPTLVRIWGNHAALLHRNRLANTQRGATFGFTAQFQNRVAGQIPEPKVGLRGGMRVRVGESVRELVVANELGYFFKNAVAG
ncbi:hypothetical protein QLH32_17550 [Acinetobacter corruptisaponis]|uniref:Phage capsid protein n=1 Tax=Acinetobacter corruptisaponis TaxID=3045147 RepID=A0ABY8S7Y5_9GAMM|nr:hypothetical protein [Acinetobacter sp. KCTC 92772]WHP05784.1 hypothetical protein QLH32_17550 [Acinetobacter sp. KCTC 92772]